MKSLLSNLNTIKKSHTKDPWSLHQKILAFQRKIMKLALQLPGITKPM
ncbi:hypothetical protein CTL2C_714 [Chlamydia trachomatis L2c]|nr:hypothetical protein CTL2C_714 [Chlamydia trachomatis L2c]